MVSNIFPKIVPFEIILKNMMVPERPLKTKYGACALHTDKKATRAQAHAYTRAPTLVALTTHPYLAPRLKKE